MRAKWIPVFLLAAGVVLLLAGLAATFPVLVYIYGFIEWKVAVLLSICWAGLLASGGAHVDA